MSSLEFADVLIGTPLGEPRSFYAMDCDGSTRRIVLTPVGGDVWRVLDNGHQAFMLSPDAYWYVASNNVVTG